MKLLKIAAAAALFASSATLVLAQSQNPNGDPRPLGPGGGDNPTVRDQTVAPTNPPKQASPDTGSGSRAIGPPGNETPAPGATQDTKKIPKSPN